VSTERFSVPDINKIEGVPIKRLPAGEALGARDLTRWSSNRSAGRSGSYTTKRERQLLDNWGTKPRAQMCMQAAAKRGVLVEQTERGWMVSAPDGSNAGPFKKEAAAWSWVDRHPARRRSS
jgi:hypothetical protein